jgi:hypothetical protein
MKRLITYNDNTYMPLWQTDFKFIQDNLIQAVSEMAKMFAAGRDMFIVSGCELSKVDGQYHVSQGMVMMDGELLYVPGQSVPADGVFKPHIRKQELFNPTGEKQFLVGQLTEFRNTWDDNYGKLHTQTDAEPMPGRLYFYEAQSIYQIIANQIKDDTGWVTLDVINGWMAEYPLQYRRVGDVVYLRGVVSSELNPVNPAIATIPQDLTRDYAFSVFNGPNTQLHINPTGVIALNIALIQGNTANIEASWMI